jgi:hypothetical protein
MTTYNEPARALEFLVSEANGHRSRDQVTLAASQGALVPGTVLAKPDASANYVVYDNASGTAGVNVAKAILCYPADDSAGTQLVSVISNDAEVQGALLDWGDNDGAGITAGTADLLAAGIKIRAA